MQNKLAAYSSAAATLIALSNIASSQIVYTDIDPDSVFIADPDTLINVLPDIYDGYHLKNFDVDGDGINDFRLKVFGYTYYVTSETAYASAVIASVKALNANLRFAGGTNSGPFLCCTPVFYNYYSLSKFDQGEMIDAADQWTHGFWGTGGNAAMMWSVINTNALFNTGSTNGGQWDDLTINNGYIAFRKKIGADYKYGWMRLSSERIPHTPGADTDGSMYYKLTVHDYAINNSLNDPLYAGEGLPDCLVPLPYDPLSITATTAKIKWAPVFAADSYQIYYRQVGGGAWQKINAGINQKKITGLLCNTDYEWKVRTKCDGENTPFSTIEYFTTASCKLLSEAIETGLTIFPNPVSNNLAVDVSEINALNFEIQISDLTGNEINSFSIQGENDLLNIDVSQFPVGMYFITISWDVSKQTLKFIKQ
jgi:hypothetical protein